MSDQPYRTKDTHPYDCKRCGDLFASSFALYQHERDKHGTGQKPLKRDTDHFTEADYQTWMKL